jgi:hypothetical protein
VKTMFPSVPSAVSAVALCPPLVTGADWRGYLAPTGVSGAIAFGAFGDFGAFSGLGSALGMPAAHMRTAALVTRTFATVAAAAPAAHVAAVAGAEQDATAPKQADKLVVTRNDANPLGTRPGAPPG